MHAEHQAHFNGDGTLKTLRVSRYSLLHVIRSPPIYSPMSMMHERVGSKEREAVSCQTYLCFPRVLCVAHTGKISGYNTYTLCLHAYNYTGDTTVQDSHSQALHGNWQCSLQGIFHCQRKYCPLPLRVLFITNFESIV